MNKLFYDPNLITAVRWLVVIAMPFMIGLGAIRAVILWDYPAWEYQRIPSDQFGFTDEERLDLAQATLAYMQRPEPAEQVIFMLEELRLPGSNDPLYNEREIEHMIDVKVVADGLWRVAQIAIVLVTAGLLFLVARPFSRRDAYRAVFHGGLATTAVLLSIGLLIGLAWEFFFVQFHELLFPPGTWVFARTDSLIRLFPEQFWFDVGVIISGGALVTGILVAALGYGLLKWSERYLV
jgi:integral membrane protein (TIGR01906 family)